MSVIGYQTAITRNKLSVPMRYLSEKNLIQLRALDYGCGKGFDADHLAMVGFDPYHRPKEPKGSFDTITCNYVLNVVPTEEDRANILENIFGLLKPNGVAYITVRRDIKQDTNTQFVVVLDLPIQHKTSTYCMYRLEKK